MTPELRLLPRDNNGRDLKTEGVVLKLKYAPRVRLLYVDRFGTGQTIECSYSWARHLLKEAGYRLHDGRERWKG